MSKNSNMHILIWDLDSSDHKAILSNIFECKKELFIHVLSFGKVIGKNFGAI